MNFSSNITNKENFFIDATSWFGQQKAAEKNENLVTIPMVESQPAKTPAQLDSTGNVPIVKNAQANETMGLGVEKTTKKPANKGVSLDQAMTNFYGKKYANASEEEKEKLIVKYFDWLSTEKKDFTTQLNQFKLYRDRCKDEGAEYKRLSSVIDKLEAKYQLPAATAVMTEGTAKQKDIGQKAVADDYHHYDKSVQVGVTKLIVDSKNEQAIKIGASHSSKLSDENQVKAVDIYKTTDISEKAKTEVGKTIVAQYADFASQNQVEIHKSMSDKNYWDTKVIEFAASNIYNFAAENQKPSVQVTVNTGNEAAIAAAAAKINYYDKTVQSAIKTTLVSTGIESVKMALANAPQPPTSTVKKESVAQKTATTTAPTVNKITLAAQAQEKFEKASLSQKMQMLSSMKGSEKEVYMKNIIKSAPPAVVLALLSTLPSSMLSSVINIVLDSNPSIEVMSKVTSLIGKVPDGDKKALIKKINDSYSTSLLNSQASMFDADFQKVVVQEMARNGKLETFGQFNWATSTKEFYKDLVKNQENNS